MSDNAIWFVDLDASLDEVQELADQVRKWLIAQGIVSPIPCQTLYASHLLSRGPSAAQWDTFAYSHPTVLCGLEIVTERTVFHSGDNGIDAIACPAYGARHLPDELPWDDAVGAWYSGEAEHSMTCPACHMSHSIVDWTFDMPWGFGNLGFGFWNWPINDRLLDELSAMTGHRYRLVHQHT